MRNNGIDFCFLLMHVTVTAFLRCIQQQQQQQHAGQYFRHAVVAVMRHCVAML
jgi:hypothetical protein